MTPAEYIEALLKVTGSVRTPGRNGRWQCPSHGRVGSHSPSLSVRAGDDGMALVHCFAGCPTRDVLHAIGLELDALRRAPRLSPARFAVCRRVERGYPTPKASSSQTPSELGFRFEAFHEYGLEHRKLRLRHPTTGDKHISWEARNHLGEWVPGLLGTREADLPLYREHDVIMGMALGEPIVLVESESSVDSLRGIYACTWAGGAGSIHHGTLRRVLHGCDNLVIVADADKPGYRCAEQLRRLLPQARVVASDQPGEDARDIYTRLGLAGFMTAIATWPDVHQAAA